MNKVSQEIIVDSAMMSEEILRQNPKSVAPDTIIDELEVLPVLYYGFDGKTHSGQIAMHKNVCADVDMFFKSAYTMKFPIEKVIPISNPLYHWDDEISCNDNNSSGYNYRTIMGTTRLSNHAKGHAFDINPVQNIFVMFDSNMNETARYPKDAIYDEQAKGTLTADHPLVLMMKKLGWTWGGDWKPEEGRVDYQHFEK